MTRSTRYAMIQKPGGPCEVIDKGRGYVIATYTGDAVGFKKALDHAHHLNVEHDRYLKEEARIAAKHIF